MNPHDLVNLVRVNSVSISDRGHYLLVVLDIDTTRYYIYIFYGVVLSIDYDGSDRVIYLNSESKPDDFNHDDRNLIELVVSILKLNQHCVDIDFVPEWCHVS